MRNIKVHFYEVVFFESINRTLWYYFRFNFPTTSWRNSFREFIILLFQKTFDEISSLEKIIAIQFLIKNDSLKWYKCYANMFLNMLCICFWNQIKLSRRIQILVPNIIHWKGNAIFPDASRYIVSTSHHATSPVLLLHLCPGSKNVAKTRPARDALDDRCHASHLFPYSNRLLGLDNYSGQVCSLPFSFPPFLHLTYYIIFLKKKKRNSQTVQNGHKYLCT